MSFIEKIISSILDEEKVKNNYKNNDFKETKVDDKSIQVLKNKKVIVINNGELKFEKQVYINLKDVDVGFLIENDKFSIDELNSEFRELDKLIIIKKKKKDKKEEEDGGEFREIEKEKRKKKKKKKKKKTEKDQWRVGTNIRNLGKEFKKEKMAQLLKMRIEKMMLMGRKERLSMYRAQKMARLAMMNANGRNAKIPRALLKKLTKLLGKSMTMKLLIMLRKKNRLNKKNINKIVKQLLKMQRKMMMKRSIIVKNFKKDKRRGVKSINKLKKIANKKKKKVKLENVEAKVDRDMEQQKAKIAKLYEVLDRRKAKGESTKMLETRIAYEEQVLDKENIHLNKIRRRKNSLGRSL